jgi:hypothetical protein
MNELVEHITNDALLAKELAMRTFRAPILIGAALFWTSMTALAQSFETLFPVQYLDQGAGCYSQRCFMDLMDLDGTTALTANTGPGLAVHVRGQAPLWTVQQALTNPDYRHPPSKFPPAQSFGFPTALEADALLATGTSPRYNMKDVVYVYRRSNGRWSHVQTLTLQRPAGYDRTLVHSIAMSGDTAIIGGTRVQDANTLPDFSQFDFYKRNADGTFSRRGGFKPPVEPRYAWYSKVVISGNIVAIGDPYAAAESGRVYLYEYGAGGWRFRRTLSPPGPVAAGRFGESIALDGGTLAVTEPQRADVRPEYLGVVHVFERSGAQWPRVQTLSGPIDPRVTGYTFGYNVAVSGRRLVVGQTTNEFSEHIPNYAYLYERRSQWLPVAHLTSEESDFNTALQLSGNIAIVGANNWAYSTPGYVFQLPALDTLPALTDPTSPN